ncbi:MAG TPA: hypothetical protein VKC90_04715, partial [Chitinophagaceae bacterium]|nr:hypothetical protein [Chitinophagaceae bacterium]
GTKPVFVLQTKKINSYLLSLSKDLLLFGPALGANSYDKFMIGGFVANLKLPPSRFQFFLAPMYATGSKKFTGIGFINHSFYPDGIFRKIDIGINASTFSYNEFPKLNGEKINFSFTKVSPELKLTFRQKDARSTLNKFIQWRTYFINEQTYGSIFYDTIINIPDTTINQVVPVISENRVLNQFKLVMENYRALYPYRGELKIEQGKDFVRAAFTGKYFFNYAKQGGLTVRLFAGKFFYTGSKTFSKQFATDRYHLNMTGANGYEDYTYSDYFIGRNKFDGLPSQQIMMKDGGFKIRTDLLSDKVGKTDNWLIATNFTTTIPSNINPLNLLPVKIPLKVFVDIGTYAEAWKPNAGTDRFLYDAGLYIPLFKETINIYVPLIYSDVYKNYIQSNLPKKNRLLKTISFSIDIVDFSLRKFDRNLDF